MHQNSLRLMRKKHGDLLWIGMRLITQTRQLNDSEKRLFDYLTYNKNDFNPTYDLLAHKLNMSKTTLKDSFLRLEECGLVEREKMVRVVQKIPIQGFKVHIKDIKNWKIADRDHILKEMLSGYDFDFLLAAWNAEKVGLAVQPIGRNSGLSQKNDKTSNPPGIRRSKRWSKRPEAGIPAPNRKESIPTENQTKDRIQIPESKREKEYKNGVTKKAANENLALVLKTVVPGLNPRSDKECQYSRLSRSLVDALVKRMDLESVIELTRNCIDNTLWMQIEKARLRDRKAEIYTIDYWMAQAARIGLKAYPEPTAEAAPLIADVTR